MEIKDLRIVLFKYNKKKYPTPCILNVLAVDTEHMGFREISNVKIPKLPKGERVHMDKDDEDYWDTKLDKAKIKKVSVVSTYFLVSSKITGEFEWISEQECVNYDSDAGQLLAKKQIKKSSGKLRRTQD